MQQTSFYPGDIIRTDGRIYEIWELSEDCIGLLPYPECDSDSTKSVRYVARDAALQLVRRRNVRTMLGVPPNAKFLVETCPQTQNDLTTMRLWTDGQNGQVDLEHIVMTGALGISDGSQKQTRNVAHADIMSIKDELERIGFWGMRDMHSNGSAADSEPWWWLAATDGVRTNAIEQCGESSAVRTVCEQCMALVDWGNLESGPFRVA